MKYEQSNYELAKQDRNASDRNLVVGQSDLVNLLRPERAVRKANGSDSQIIEGDNENNDQERKPSKSRLLIDEDMLKELCAISN